MSPSNQDWNPAKIGAALWLLTIIVAVAISGVLALSKLNVSGTVTADVFVRNVAYPLTVSLGGILFLGSYVAMKVLWGEERTDSALSKLIGVIKESGAAEELRAELRENRENREE